MLKQSDSKKQKIKVLDTKKLGVAIHQINERLRNVKFLSPVLYLVIIAILVIVCIIEGSVIKSKDNEISSIIAAQTEKENKAKDEENKKLEEVDVNGMTVKEACEKVREKGWKVDYIISYTTSPGKSTDCSNENERVTSYNYSQANKNMSMNSKATSGATNSGNSSNSSNNTSASGSSSSSSSPSSSSSSSSEWKQFLKDYEAWMDDYVAFMKKYKNASSSDLPAMMNDYTNMMTKVTEWSDKASKMQSKLSGSDLTEYLQTLNRIVQKMSEV